MTRPLARPPLMVSFAAALFLPDACLAQSATPPIVFERTVLDLGPISDRQVRTEAFMFTNVSDKPVRLLIDGCHTCGVPTCSRDEIPPGERAAVLVDINPAGKTGLMRAGGTVTVQGIKDFSVNIDVTATVKPLVWTEPDYIRIYSLPRGTTGIPFTLNLCSSLTDFKLLSLNIEGNAITASSPAADNASSSQTDPTDFTRLPVIVVPNPKLPVGVHESSIRMTTSDPQRPDISVTARIEVVSNFVSEPEAVLLGEMEVFKPFQHSFVVTSRDAAPFQLVSLEVLDPALFTNIVLDYAWTPAGVVVTVVGFTPGRGIVHTEARIGVRLIAPDGVEELLTVPIACRVREYRQRKLF